MENLDIIQSLKKQHIVKEEESTQIILKQDIKLTELRNKLRFQEEQIEQLNKLNDEILNKNKILEKDLNGAKTLCLELLDKLKLKDKNRRK